MRCIGFPPHPGESVTFIDSVRLKCDEPRRVKSATRLDDFFQRLSADVATTDDNDDVFALVSVRAKS